MAEKIISILGCGWLGFSLAQRLISKGYYVNGSTTSPEKIKTLEKENILPFHIDIDEGYGKNSFIPPLFLNCHCLIITLPFRKSLENPFEYFHQINRIIYYLEKQTCRNVIFTSSTSIYPKKNEVVDEFSEIDMKSKRAKILLETEDLLLHNQHFKSSILRLGGLFGGNRNPGKFLSGRRVQGTGAEPVNYIHREVCIDIIEKMLLMGVTNETFNLVSDDHLSKAEFYSNLANDLNTEGPTYSGLSEPYKIVSNLKIKQRYNLKSIPLFPNRTDAI